ncbi:MAG: DUF5686 family protein [Chloroherpetonaceae bacterium]|nr:DUF5686 family protein [Chloroherpetonaceae bacterium]
MLLALAHGVLFLSASLSQTVSGKVTDAKTGEALIGATVQLKQGEKVVKGARTNNDGAFRLNVPEGRYALEVRFVGYETYREEIAVALSLERDIRLKQGEVTASEIVVSANEDLATTIIRRAIRYKRSQRRSLETYQVEAYRKQLLKSDTSIAAIAEVFANGYWRKGDTLREVVVQERLTENVKSDLRGSGAAVSAGLRFLVDFSEERIWISGNKVVGPIADDALDYYKYELVEIKKADDVEFYTLRLLPQSKFLPLFKGQIRIASNAYALIGVDVEPTAGFRLPYIEDAVFRYKQTQEYFTDSLGRGYWLPANQVIEGGLTVSVGGGLIELPRISFVATTAIRNYKINVGVPDSLFVQKLVQKAPTAERFDSLFWQGRDFVSLTAEEVKAYQTLDSAKSIASQFKPRGAIGGMLIAQGRGGGVSVGGISGLGLLDVPMIRFNRVEGWFLGAQLHLDSLMKTTDARGSVGYGFEREEVLWTAGATQWLDDKRVVGVSLDFYKTTSFTPEWLTPWDISNAYSALVYKEDYHNYFQAQGWKLAFVHQPKSNLFVSLGYRSQTERSMRNETNYSVFSRRVPFRPNPAIRDGNARSLVLSAEYGLRLPLLGLRSPIWAKGEIEHSSSPLGSDFEFTRLWAVTAFKKNAFFGDRLLAPHLLVFAEAGALLGADKVPQRYFSTESPIAYFAEQGALLGLGRKEFVGEYILTLNVEHNFQSVPFEAIGFDWAAERFLQLFVRGGAARVWLNGVPRQYYEAGFGLGGILGLFRASLVWGFRENSPADMRLIFGMGLLL